MPSTGAGSMRARKRHPGTIVVVPGLRFDMLQLEIEHAELHASRRADQRIRPLRPPVMHDVAVRAGVLEAVLRQRFFCLVAAGDDSDALARKLKRFEPSK